MFGHTDPRSPEYNEKPEWEYYEFIVLTDEGNGDWEELKRTHSEEWDNEWQNELKYAIDQELKKTYPQGVDEKTITFIVKSDVWYAIHNQAIVKARLKRTEPVSRDDYE